MLVCLIYCHTRLASTLKGVAHRGPHPNLGKKFPVGRGSLGDVTVKYGDGNHLKIRVQEIREGGAEPIPIHCGVPRMDIEIEILSFNDGLCEALHFLLFISMSASNALLLAIAIQRYLKVCWPLGKQMELFGDVLRLCL